MLKLPDNENKPFILSIEGLDGELSRIVRFHVASNLLQCQEDSLITRRNL